MKICTKCKKEKEEDEFQSEKRKFDGLSSRCKKCLNEDKKIYLDAKRSKIREYNRKKYHENHEIQKKLRTERSRKLREENPEKANADKRNWYKKNSITERQKANLKGKDPEVREKTYERARKYRKTEKYKFKKRARSAFERALKYGFIQRPKMCSKCDIECKPDGHHNDYNKPLEVQWLCKKCHFQAHGKLMDI